MKKEIKNILLKIKLISLRNKRLRMVNNIIDYKQNYLQRVEKIEDVNKSFFIKIDNEIEKVKRLMKIKKLKQ